MVMEQPALSLKIVRVVKNLTDGTLSEVLKNEGQEPYLRALDEADVLMVDNDAPRDGPFTEELMEKTLGFALVDSMGRVYKKTKDLSQAYKALDNATINFDVSVDVDDDEQENT